jgi:hypothetical protein
VCRIGTLKSTVKDGELCPARDISELTTSLGSLGSVHIIWSGLIVLLSTLLINSGDSITQGAHDQSRGFGLAAELQAGIVHHLILSWNQ